MKEIKEIPSNYQYVLLRGNHEYLAVRNNLAFMLSIHKNDIDDSFLKSEQYKKLEEKSIEKQIQKSLFEVGVATLLNNNKVPNQFQIKNDEIIIEN